MAVETARPDSTVPARAGRLMDALTAPLERSARLDRLGRRLTNVFARFVKAGTAKDLLAGTWQGHPVHPLLTDVTIGAWLASTLLDQVRDPDGEGAADVLLGLGIASAVPTAITGWSDLSDIVNEDERGIGTAHALGNATALAFYTASLVARRTGLRGAGRALSLLGAGAMTFSGFLGGHLAYRKGVGVNQTAFGSRLTGWKAVLEEAELLEGRARRVNVDGTEVMLCRSGGRIHAIVNRCSHRGGPLHKGRIEHGTVTCPWHLSTFGLEDGSVVRGPATAPQPVYEVRTREGTIELRSRTVG